MVRQTISEGRKIAYYGGGAITIVGAILFLSFMVRVAAGFGDPRSIANSTTPLLPVIGMILMILGKSIRGVGRAGLAGSGVLLDPQKAREDLEPWNRMAGGMAKDALDEAGVDLGRVGERLAAGEDLPFDEKLRRLHALRQDGILSAAEYEEQKQRLLKQG